MKKITVLITAALLLAACGKKLTPGEAFHQRFTAELTQNPANACRDDVVTLALHDAVLDRLVQALQASSSAANADLVAATKDITIHNYTFDYLDSGRQQIYCAALANVVIHSKTYGAITLRPAGLEYLVAAGDSGPEVSFRGHGYAALVISLNEQLKLLGLPALSVEAAASGAMSGAAPSTPVAAPGSAASASGS